MKLAYIILVHRDPVLFGRLVARLNVPGITSFVVHIDKKVADVSPYQGQVKGISDVYYTERVNGCWGGYSLVQATLNAIQTLVETKIEYDYAIMMSGQDYPLKSNGYIHDFFKYADGLQFMEAFSPSTGTKVWQKDLFGSRLEDYYYRTVDGRSWYRYDGFSRYWRCEDARSDKSESAWIPCADPGNGLFDAEDCKGARRNRRPAFIQEWWGGSQWWALTREAVEYIHKTVGEDNGYIRFHQYTFIPDENFFQSLILNSKAFGKRVINNRLRFVDFSDPDPRNMPRTFGEDYLPELIEFCTMEYPKYLFARKFDSTKSASVLDEIDKLI